MVSNPQKIAPVIDRSLKSIYIDGKKYPLSEQVIKNIETVIGYQAKQVQKVPVHDRLLNKITAFFGKSQFLYLQLIFFFGWWFYSHISVGSLVWNLPKFNFQGMAIDVASLLIATGVLVQQSRQDRLAEQRSHLMLQINLLTEQKIAKMIELMEELRTDLPYVRDRHDWEAQIMQQATDPQAVLDILQENLETVEADRISNLNFD